MKLKILHNVPATQNLLEYDLIKLENEIRILILFLKNQPV